MEILSSLYHQQFIQDCAHTFDVAPPCDLTSQRQLRCFVLACIAETQTWQHMETYPRELYLGLKWIERRLAHKPDDPAPLSFMAQVRIWIQFLIGLPRKAPL